jgi:Flp pilus assembly protein TadD
LLVAVTLATFSPILQCGFVNYDDDEYVTRNPHVQAGLTLRGIAWAWTTTHAANWHPLTWLSLMADGQFFGTRAWGYHLTNLLWHAANAVLVFALFRRLTGELWPSAVLAALFAVHPLHVESVAWVSERKDVLSTFFGLLSLLAYVGYVAAPGPGRYLVALMAFALSLLAKPMWVTLPCLLLLLDWWPLRRLCISAPANDRPEAAGAAGVPPGRLLVEKFPFFALSAASSVLTVWAQSRAVVPLARVPLPARLANAAVSVLHYFRQTVLPLDLAAFYPHPGNSVSLALAAGAGLVLLLVTALLLWGGRRLPYLPVGWLWFLGTLVPVIGLVQVGGQARADRYTYLPLLGIFLLLTWGLVGLARRWRRQALAAALCGCLLVFLMGASRNQTHVWHDSIALWQHDLETAGESARAHYNLGSAWMEERGNPDRALWQLQQALRLDPTDAKVHNNLGVVCRARGDWAEAARHFRDALRMDPANARTHNNLGVALLNQREYAEALSHFQESLRLDPQQARVHHHLGLTYLGLGQWPDAAPCFRRAIDLEPGPADYHRDLAFALHQLGQAEAAQAEYRKALDADPEWPQTLLGTAWELATHPDPRRRNGPRALRLAEQVAQLRGEQDPRVLEVLAAAYAETGQFALATARTQKAHALAAAAHQTERAAALEDRLHLYENNRPFYIASPDGGGIASAGPPEGTR